MFFGTIDDNVRRYIAAQAEAFKGAEVVVGCSGNYTSEKVIAVSSQPAALHSNDVSLYSLLLADAMLGNRSPVEVQEAAYTWLQPFLDHADLWQRPAMLMMLLRLLKHEKRRTIHDRRMYAHYLARFQDLVEATAARLAERRVPIASYFSGDVMAHYQRFADRDDVIFTGYFPFFKGDYERQYKRAGAILQWPAPTYPLLDAARKADIIAWLQQPGRRYMFLLPDPLEGQEPQMISHKQRNTWVYLYANLHVRTGLFRRKYGDSGRRFRLATPGFPWSAQTQVRVIEIGSNDIQYYKQLFLARNIDFTAAERGFLVAVDELVLGFIEFNRIRGAAQFTIKGTVYRGEQIWYLLSDFPVAPLAHPRASKLIVMLAICDEMRRKLDYKRLLRTSGVVTTARTRRPVSMKYRGPMQLIKRDVAQGFLNYGALWSRFTCAEVYQQWWKTYGKNWTASTSSSEE